MAILLHIEDVIAGNTFGERLRNARIMRGLTAQEVAEQIKDLSYATYKSYENKSSQPKQRTLVQLSEILQVSIDQLLGTKATRNGQLVGGQVISFVDNGYININQILKAFRIAVDTNRAVYYNTDDDREPLPICHTGGIGFISGNGVVVKETAYAIIIKKLTELENELNNLVKERDEQVEKQNREATKEGRALLAESEKQIAELQKGLIGDITKLTDDNTD